MKASSSFARVSFIAAFAVFTLLGTAAIASAGTPEVDAPPAAPPPNKYLESFVATSVTNYFDASFTDNRVDLSVIRYSLYSEFKFRLSPDWMFKIFPYGDFSQYSIYDRVPTVGFRLPEAMRDAYYLNLDATLAYMFAPGWSIVGGGRITSGASTKASFSDSITGGGIFAIKKSLWNNAIDFTFGVSYTSRLVQSWQLLPYFDVDVNVLPSFVKIPINLRLLYNGGLLSYRFTDSFAVTLQGRYDSRYYRLPSNIGFFHKGVVSEYGLELGGGFTYAPRRKNWALSLTGGVELFRRVNVYYFTGNALFAEDVNPTPFLSATFHAAF